MGNYLARTLISFIAAFPARISVKAAKLFMRQSAGRVLLARLLLHPLLLPLLLFLPFRVVLSRSCLLAVLAAHLFCLFACHINCRQAGESI